MQFQTKIRKDKNQALGGYNLLSRTVRPNHGSSTYGTTICTDRRCNIYNYVTCNKKSPVPKCIGVIVELDGDYYVHFERRGDST